MTLAELIKVRGKTVRECAVELELDRTVLTRFANRQRTPSVEQSLRIIAWSEGQIELVDLVAHSRSEEAISAA